jgi:hypothetical protein
MSEYIVQVINRDTGKETAEVIRAESSQSAYDIAASRGWIVGRVTLASKPKPTKDDHGKSDSARLLLAIGMVIGVFLFVAFLMEPTSYDGVHNLGRIHNRSMGLMVACFMLATGTIGLILLAILAELRRAD